MKVEFVTDRNNNSKVAWKYGHDTLEERYLLFKESKLVQSMVRWRSVQGGGAD